MKTKPYRTVKVSTMALLMASALWCMPAPAQAAIVTQLDIAGGSIGLNFGGLGSVNGNFTQNGQLVMGQYQPAPNLFEPITISHLTFSIFTGSGGTLNLSAPTAQTSGSALTSDLRSLFAGVTSAGWAGLLTSPSTPLATSLNIGGVATGSFNEITNAFDISWTHQFTGVPSLTSGTFSLHGTAQFGTAQPVPVPAAVMLFGSGLFGIVGVVIRRATSLTGQGVKACSAPILLLSPDAIFAKEIETQLARSGYHLHIVASVSDAFPFALQEMPALTLVDQRLSDWDQIRTDKHLHHVPMMIVVPTGTGYSEDDGIFDLERGADGVHLYEEGYRLLLAKVGTYLRRAGSVDSKRGLYRVGAVELDSDLQQVKIGANIIPLSAKPFAILKALIKAPSKVFSRGHLINLVWGPDFAIGDHVLDVHVHALRRSLQQDHDPLCRLVTIKSVGFKLTSCSPAMPTSSASDTFPMAVNSLPLSYPSDVQDLTLQRTIAQPQSTSRRTWLEQVSRQRRGRLLRKKQSLHHLCSATSIGQTGIEPFHNSVAASSIHR
ncbi:MAG: response regulator transcription factor [Nitrospira sp. CG24C]|jgi:DNA-binding response OmpR family regulator|nr:MAG: response regulator transcription factor [Nitrospira sp. CG24C]